MYQDATQSAQRIFSIKPNTVLEPPENCPKPPNIDTTTGTVRSVCVQHKTRPSLEARKTDLMATPGEGRDIIRRSDLNHYFKNHVVISQSIKKEVYEIVHRYIDPLLEKIHKEEPRFGKDPIKMGSSAQGLKVSEPNEFDFGIILEGLPVIHWKSYEPRYFQLSHWPECDSKGRLPANIDVVEIETPLGEPEEGFTDLRFSPHESVLWDETCGMRYQEHIIPFLVNRNFRNHLFNATEYLQDHLGLDIGIDRLGDGPATILTIHVPNFPKFPISVDLTPTARLRLPFPDDVIWPRPDARWPSAEKAMSVREKGVNLVAKENMDWSISFAEPERELRKHMDEDGGCRAKVHRIMKKVNADFIDRNMNKPIVTSYHLKNVLFWECEEFPDSDSWAQDQMAERFNSMLDRLETWVRAGNLPLYFNPQVNLLKDKDRRYMRDYVVKLVKFRQNASHLLRQVRE